MNKLKKMMATAIVVAASTVAVNAQETAKATAAVEIVTPLEITTDAHLNFGRIAVRTTQGGTVSVTTAGGATRTDGVTLVAGGTVTAAEFTVTGADGYMFNITLPGDNDVVLTAQGAGTGADIRAVGFESSIGNSGTLTSGTATFAVGATLNIPAGQDAGSYLSADFDVTVIYQ